MFIEKQGFEVDGVDFGQYLLQIDYGYNKLWASDTRKKFSRKTSGNSNWYFSKI